MSWEEKSRCFDHQMFDKMARIGARMNPFPFRFPTKTKPPFPRLVFFETTELSSCNEDEVYLNE